MPTQTGEHQHEPFVLTPNGDSIALSHALLYCPLNGVEQIGLHAQTPFAVAGIQKAFTKTGRATEIALSK